MPALSLSHRSLSSPAAAVLPLVLQRRGEPVLGAWKHGLFLTTDLPGALAALELCREGAPLVNRKRAWLPAVPLLHNLSPKAAVRL